MHHHLEIFKKVDVIVTPTTGMTAPKIPPSALENGESNMQVSGYLMRFILAANLLGLPAITVPVGHDKQGLPIGLQLIGRPWGEATILRLASAIEELCAESRRKPASFHDILKTKLESIDSLTVPGNRELSSDSDEAFFSAMLLFTTLDILELTFIAIAYCNYVSN
ncbi:hypothetical protein Goari_005806 [Gossypium aridum]|uniref:Amidase domain-containing protein n=1 Tax=Gossypium aridum TaxID=34290 RepID=A0A7J8XL66_GOSAI|nr:hypothetical protein [Gossypium aridum]